MVLHHLINETAGINSFLAMCSTGWVKYVPRLFGIAAWVSGMCARPLLEPASPLHVRAEGRAVCARPDAARGNTVCCQSAPRLTPVFGLEPLSPGLLHACKALRLRGILWAGVPGHGATWGTWAGQGCTCACHTRTCTHACSCFPSSYNIKHQSCLYATDTTQVSAESKAVLLEAVHSCSTHTCTHTHNMRTHKHTPLLAPSLCFPPGQVGGSQEGKRPLGLMLCQHVGARSGAPLQPNA